MTPHPVTVQNVPPDGVFAVKLMLATNGVHFLKGCFSCNEIDLALVNFASLRLLTHEPSLQRCHFDAVRACNPRGRSQLPPFASQSLQKTSGRDRQELSLCKRGVLGEGSGN